MSEFSDFFTNLFTPGDKKRELAAQQLAAELELAEKQLELERQKAELKLDPELARVKNIRYIVLGVVGLIVIYILVKYVL